MGLFDRERKKKKAENRDPIKQKIDREEVRTAMQTLQSYKNAKAHLDERIVHNEQWYKERHWDEIRGAKQKSAIEPTSGWLLNVLLSKHADAMDSYPEGNFLPREEGDKEEAKRLSAIVPCVLKQNKFEQTYSDTWWYKLKNGTGVYAVTWDASKHNGIGDIEISKVDMLNLFWQSGITNIQESRNVFHTYLVDNDILEQKYPELQDRLSNPSVNVASYIYDDTVDTSDKSVVVDWYYKVSDTKGRQILHFCKFVDDTVLFATENEPEKYPNGWYDDGQYPFVFDVLFPEEGMPTGFGYVDICKSPQEQIDLMNQGIVKSALMGANPRYFIREDGNVNETEFSDWTKPFIHVKGNLGEDSIRQVSLNTLSNIYVSILNNKIEEMKETSGNRDVSNGGTTAGVTAASAIAALQEQSGKQSRDMIQASYRAYEEMLTMVLERIRQFYTLPRQFRIIGKYGEEEFVRYQNSGIRAQEGTSDFGVDGGYRVPEFDIEVTAQKSSPYSKMAQNELALQLYTQGIFNPQMADQALALLDMMDFSRKDSVIQKVSQNGTMYQQMQAMQQQMAKMAQIIDAQNGTTLAQSMGAVSPQIQGSAPNGESVNLYEQDALGTVVPEEHAVVRKARETASQVATPR